jgi:hypothetical protein
MVAKKKKTTKTKLMGKFGAEEKEDAPHCSKCHKKMEMVDVIPEDGGRSLTVRHKCPSCTNMWSIRTLSNVTSNQKYNPRLSDMYR